MRRVACSNVVISSLLVMLEVVSIQACAKKKAGSPQADPRYVAASQSLERLKADAQKLQVTTAAIHKRLEQVEATADNLPGLAAFRSNLFATEEVLGGVGSTVEFLATEGDNVVVEATWFISEDWPGPAVIGWKGCLERFRFALDPSDDSFYFGSL